MDAHQASFSEVFDKKSAPLYTDLYQLTMLQAYWREGMDETAVFDLFVRRLRDRNYLVACGLEQALEYLEELSFSAEAIDYLAEQPQFDDAFLRWLGDFEFTGDVYAVPEETPVFSDEPIQGGGRQPRGLASPEPCHEQWGANRRGDGPAPGTHREHAAARRSELPDTLRRLEGEEAYDVVLNDCMEERLEATRRHLKSAM